MIVALSGVVLLWLFLRTPSRPHNALSDLGQDDTNLDADLGAAAVASSTTHLHHRTVAVADLHGDYAHALNVLHMSGVIDRDSSGGLQALPLWSGSRATLVSTGDIVDRGDDTIPLYRLFSSLRSQAARAGGRVFNCLGNHEMMNALGDWRYVTQGDVNSFGGVDGRKHAISVDGWVGQEWMEHYDVSHSLPLFPLADLEKLQGLPQGYTPPQANFVHGGIHPSWTHGKPTPLADIVATGHSLLNKTLTRQADPYEPLARGRLPPTTTPHEHDIWTAEGPFWYRGYATEADETVACDLATQAAKALHVDFLVMGHTPHFDGFVHRCDPPLIHLIDTGISRAYGGEQSALVFDSELQWHEGDGKWHETVTLIALYRGRRPRIVHTRRRVVE